MNCLMRAWQQLEAELRGWLRHRLGNNADVEAQLQDLSLKALRQGTASVHWTTRAPGYSR